jgi:Ca2+-binding EF-hand superfamily protein
MISLEELTEHVMQMPVSKQNVIFAQGGVQMLMSQLDLNGDGQISREEWMLFLINRKLSAKEERLHQAFRKFDLNNDGKITPDEVRLVLNAESDAVAHSLLIEIDKDGNGSVDYEEFLSMWEKKTSTPKFQRPQSLYRLMSD